MDDMESPVHINLPHRENSEVSLSHTERKVHGDDAIGLASRNLIREDHVLPVHPTAALIQGRLLELRRPNERVLLLLPYVRGSEVFRPQRLALGAPDRVV